MAVKLGISADKLGASDEILKKLGENSSKAQADALNRTLAGMRTDATRLIVKQSGLKRPEVFKSFSLIKASGKSAAPKAVVNISGSPVPVYKFAARPAAPMTGKTRGGVSYRVGESRIKFQHAFVAKMHSGHIGVFGRSNDRFMQKNKNRNAIDEQFGPSVPQFAGRETVENPVMDKAAERFSKRFDQQVNRFLKSKGVK